MPYFEHNSLIIISQKTAEDPGDAKGGILQVKLKEDVVAVEFYKVNHQVKIKAADPDRIQFFIHINMKALGTHLMEQLDTNNPTEVAELEAALEEEVKRLAMNAIKKIQTDYKTDVLKLGRYLKIKNYRLWESIQNEWDRGNNYFSKCDIEVTAEVSIDNFQNIKKSYKE